MEWSTLPGAVPLKEIGWINTTFLASASLKCDPMMVWGTTVDVEAHDAFLAEQRRATGRIVSTAHLLVRAVAASLEKHPEVNRRVIGRRVYQYDGVNIVVPMLQTSSGEVDCLQFQHVEKLSLTEIAERFWNEARQMAVHKAEERRLKTEPWSFGDLLRAIYGRIRLEWIRASARFGFEMANRWRLPTLWSWQRELYGAGAFVNYLGFPGAPPMITHKPASLPMNSYCIAVTMGLTEPKPVVVDGQVVVRKQAPLFVRVDHRMINGNQAAGFIATLRNFLTNPASLLQSDPAQSHTAPVTRKAA